MVFTTTITIRHGGARISIPIVHSLPSAFTPPPGPTMTRIRSPLLSPSSAGIITGHLQQTSLNAASNRPNDVPSFGKMTLRKAMMGGPMLVFPKSYDQVALRQQSRSNANVYAVVDHHVEMPIKQPEQVIRILVVGHVTQAGVIEAGTEEMKEIFGFHGIDPGHPPRPE